MASLPRPLCSSSSRPACGGAIWLGAKQTTSTPRIVALQTTPRGLQSENVSCNRASFSEEEQYLALSAHAGIPVGRPAREVTAEPPALSPRRRPPLEDRALPHRDVPSEDMTRDLEEFSAQYLGRVV
jgi:hypothetical protein